MRNMLAVAKILGSIDPEVIEAVQRSIPPQFKDRNARRQTPVPSIWKMIRTFWSPPDEAVVARVLAGDHAAFEAIVRRWQSPLVNLAWRFYRDRARAEEMAQEAFLRAWRNLSQFRGESAFSTWLFALATNLYRTELRRVPAIPLSLDEIAEPPDPAVAGSAFDEASRDESLRRAVLALPPKYRDAILLFYFHEQDVPAAARTLRIPEGTVKAHLFRGRELLRSKFSRPGKTSKSASLAPQHPKEAR